MSEQQKKWNESFKTGRDYNPMNELLMDLILGSISNKKEVAIDLGCGTGDAVVKLAKRGFMVTGVDWSSDALEKAKGRTFVAGVNEKTNFVESNLNNLTNANLTKNEADIVFCKLVIAFVNDKKQFCKVIKQLLNSEGVFVLQTPVSHTNIKYSLEDKPEIAVNYEEIKSILIEVFSDVVEFNHSYYSERGDLVTFLAK